MIFKFFNKKEELNNESDLLNVACLMIHAAKIDENYTEMEKKIIKSTLEKLNSKFLEYGIDDSLFQNKQILGKYLTIIKNTNTPLNCNIITTIDNSNNNLGFNSLFNVVDKEDVIGITINIDLNKTLAVLFKFEEVWFDNQHII